MSQTVPQHPVLSLYDAGYRDLVPVIPPGSSLSPASKLRPTALGKVPGIRGNDGLWHGLRGWQKSSPTRAEVQVWLTDGASIGLRTQRHPTIDVDVPDIELAEEIRRAIADTIGSSPHRTGRPPKFAMPCRATEPFRKVTLTLRDRAGASRGVIELLGADQQFLVFGVHPLTGQPYSWHEGNTTGAVDLLAAHPPETLPLLTPAIILERFVPALETRLRALGIETIERGGAGVQKSAEDAVDQSDLRAPNIESLRCVVELMRNDDRWDAREEYIKFACAIKAAAGPEQADAGLEILHEWTSRWEGGTNDSDVVAADWTSLRPPFRVGWDWLCAAARADGYEQAPNEFDAVHDTAFALLPAAASSKYHHDQRQPIAATASEPERIAALISDPARALAFVLPELVAADITGDALMSKYDELRRAATCRDSLDELFRWQVFPAAQRLGVRADDARRFAFALEARLSNPENRHSQSWAACRPEDRRLLLNAAFAALADRSTLSGMHGLRPGPPVDTVRDEEELLKGFIPRRGMAMFVAPPGSGKTFLSLDLAARVAQADPLSGGPARERFVGHEVRHGTVLYFSSEDVDGLVRRRQRWEAQFGRADHLHIFRGVPPLRDLDATIAFVQAAWGSVSEQRPDAPPIALVIIDIMRAAILGDENSSEVAGEAMTTVATVCRMFDTATLQVHHAGREDQGRVRGSSAFDGAQDFIGAIKKKGSFISLTVTKNKNGPGGQCFEWALEDAGVLSAQPRAVEAADAPLSQSRVATLARVAALVVWDIARPQLGVTKQEVGEAMSAARPDLFDPELRKASTLRSDKSRAIAEAIDQGWVQVGKMDKLFRGTAEPPAQPLETGDLQALLSA